MSAGHNVIQSHSINSLEHEEELAPPIASRPERTKSIVSVAYHIPVKLISNKKLFLTLTSLPSILVRLMNLQ